ncbi:extracellular matrix regulator RemB [Amphibacillus xylanus]|uniref:Uncharacterized protein n=1 Tax=Amphibacillus xylanus (strain ATCC 51415 / DSM 6626 / JCM 7361 / LMG 17667 / NBRC 15112 / Ep01) TaxID=698758 RepID=K0IYS9_AMPXN|nr:extracellular matrix/biofilm biosynthesis regulator RemA family protein [Amphibacillus xylanus]BAM46137.1 hypothetical protein AXY_00050 [Amphibacillus xylanus NBRC 15112]
MFFDIGDQQFVKSDDIVMMIDQQYVDSSVINGEMIEYQQNLNDKQNQTDKPKTIVVTKDNIYYSSLSITTLKKRSSLQMMINHLDDYTDGDTFT